MSYAPVTSNSLYNFPCFFCHEDLSSTDAEVVVHDGNGSKHPVHRECIKLWAKEHSTCPVCRMQINQGSLYSLRDRAIRELSLVAKDARSGIVGMMGAGSFALARSAVYKTSLSNSIGHFLPMALIWNSTSTMVPILYQKRPIASIACVISRIAVIELSELAINSFTGSLSSPVALVAALGVEEMASIIQGFIDRQWLIY